MAHRRALIREAVVETLKSANTNAGARVFSNRHVPMWTEELPAILVYTGPEKSKKVKNPNGSLERTVDVSIELVVSGTLEDNLADQIDAFAEQVESAMQANPDLGKTVHEHELTMTDPEFMSDGEKPIGALKLTYSVTYYTGRPGDR